MPMERFSHDTCQRVRTPPTHLVPPRQLLHPMRPPGPPKHSCFQYTFNVCAVECCSSCNEIICIQMYPTSLHVSGSDIPMAKYLLYRGKTIEYLFLLSFVRIPSWDCLHKIQYSVRVKMMLLAQSRILCWHDMTILYSSCKAAKLLFMRPLCLRRISAFVCICILHFRLRDARTTLSSLHSHLLLFSVHHSARGDLLYPIVYFGLYSPFGATTQQHNISIVKSILVLPKSLVFGRTRNDKNYLLSIVFPYSGRCFLVLSNCLTLFILHAFLYKGGYITSSKGGYITSSKGI